MQPIPPRARGRGAVNSTWREYLPAEMMAAINAGGQHHVSPVGDTGAAKTSRTQSAATAIAEEAAVADAMAADMEAGGANAPAFFFHLGDVVYNFGEAQYYYDQFYEPFRDYDRPIFAIPGNHDGMVFGATSSAPQVPTLAAFLTNFCAAEPAPSPDAPTISRSVMTQPAFISRWTRRSCPSSVSTATCSIRAGASFRRRAANTPSSTTSSISLRRNSRASNLIARPGTARAIIVVAPSPALLRCQDGRKWRPDAGHRHMLQERRSMAGRDAATRTRAPLPALHPHRQRPSGSLHRLRLQAALRPLSPCPARRPPESRSAITRWKSADRPVRLPDGDHRREDSHSFIQERAARETDATAGLGNCRPGKRTTPRRRLCAGPRARAQTKGPTKTPKPKAPPAKPTKGVPKEEGAEQDT